MASKLAHHMAAVRRENATGVWIKFGNRRGDFDLSVPEPVSSRPSSEYPAPSILREGRYLLKLVSSQLDAFSFLPVHPSIATVNTLNELEEARAGDPLFFVGPDDVLLGTVSFDLLTA